MKQPRPTPPKDAPLGTVTLGGPIGWFSVALHITGDDLQPEVVSGLLGVQPTASQSKGIPLLRDDGTTKRVPRFGRWTLQIRIGETDEWDIEEVIRTLMARLPSKVETWKALPAQGRIHLSVGLSLSTSNQEFSLAPDVLLMLGERGIRLDFDVYDKEF